MPPHYVPNPGKPLADALSNLSGQFISSLGGVLFAFFTSATEVTQPGNAMKDNAIVAAAERIRVPFSSIVSTEARSPPNRQDRSRFLALPQLCRPAQEGDT